jgi:hypothetical protein
MAKYQIYRPFRSNRPHAFGDVVELKGPNLRQLEELGYIERVSDDTPLVEGGVAVAAPVVPKGTAKAAKPA